MLDVVREMPCAEDFEPWGTNVRKDFLRKWYHTRSKKVKATLSPKDMAILELRVEGYGYQEIADKLGYKTHSAVVKRMEAIKRRFIQYEEEAGR